MLSSYVLRQKFHDLGSSLWPSDVAVEQWLSDSDYGTVIIGQRAVGSGQRAGRSGGYSHLSSPSFRFDSIVVRLVRA